MKLAACSLLLFASITAKNQVASLTPLEDIGGAAPYPLDECQGDCDNDDECAGDLVCFQRDVDGPIPGGCTGAPSSIASAGWDYCYDPTWLTEVDVSPTSPLGLCQGDCDSDAECAGDLVCFHRDEGDPGPPGCKGEPALGFSGWDYCYDPTTPAPTANPTSAPTSSPTVAPTVPACLDDPAFTFVTNRGKTRRCKWIYRADDFKDPGRQGVYCDNDVEYKGETVKISDVCCESCTPFAG